MRQEIIVSLQLNEDVTEEEVILIRDYIYHQTIQAVDHKNKGWVVDVEALPSGKTAVTL